MRAAFLLVPAGVGHRYAWHVRVPLPLLFLIILFEYIIFISHLLGCTYCICGGIDADIDQNVRDNLKIKPKNTFINSDVPARAWPESPGFGLA